MIPCAPLRQGARSMATAHEMLYVSIFLVNDFDIAN